VICSASAKPQAAHGDCQAQSATPIGISHASAKRQRPEAKNPANELVVVTPQCSGLRHAGVNGAGPVPATAG
jgi:hypothetical protein